MPNLTEFFDLDKTEIDGLFSMKKPTVQQYRKLPISTSSNKLERIFRHPREELRHFFT